MRKRSFRFERAVRVKGLQQYTSLWTNKNITLNCDTNSSATNCKGHTSLSGKIYALTSYSRQKEGLWRLVLNPWLGFTLAGEHLQTLLEPAAMNMGKNKLVFFSPSQKHSSCWSLGARSGGVLPQCLWARLISCKREENRSCSKPLLAPRVRCMQ